MQITCIVMNIVYKIRHFDLLMISFMDKIKPLHTLEYPISVGVRLLHNFSKIFHPTRPYSIPYVYCFLGKYFGAWLVKIQNHLRLQFLIVNFSINQWYLPKFPPNTVIPYHTFINFHVFFHPIRLFHTIRLLDSLEYGFELSAK